MTRAVANKEWGVLPARMRENGSSLARAAREPGCSRGVSSGSYTGSRQGQSDFARDYAPGGCFHARNSDPASATHGDVILQLSRVDGEAPMDRKAPGNTPSLSLERFFAMIGALVCLDLTLGIWQVFGPQQPMWPLPPSFSAAC